MRVLLRCHSVFIRGFHKVQTLTSIDKGQVLDQGTYHLQLWRTPPSHLDPCSTLCTRAWKLIQQLSIPPTSHRVISRNSKFLDRGIALYWIAFLRPPQSNQPSLLSPGCQLASHRRTRELSLLTQQLTLDNLLLHPPLAPLVPRHRTSNQRSLTNKTRR